MKNKTNNLRKKLRISFRENQKENFWLGFLGYEDSLMDRLPLNAYEKFVKTLSDDEFYELFLLFYMEKGRIFTAIVSIEEWVKRCCRCTKLLDSLPDQQLEEILNDESFFNCDRVDLFLKCGKFERQQRILYLLHQEELGQLIGTFSDLLDINRVLAQLHQKEGEKASRIFQKLASLPEDIIANLLIETEGFVVKRILQEIKKLSQDEISIYEKIHASYLYDVLKKTDFDLLDNADSDVYTWVYNHIDEEDEEDFFCYLADEKVSEMEVFDATICVGIYNVLDWEMGSSFVKDIFTKNGCEAFENFYEKLPNEDKEGLFDLLLEDDEGRKMIDFLLDTKSEEDLGLLERLVKEKYITQK